MTSSCDLITWQALLPGNVPVNIVYIGPETSAHDRRVLRTREGRADVSVTAFRCLYEEFMQKERWTDGGAPSLFLAQNCGLEDKSMFQLWKPALAQVSILGKVHIRKVSILGKVYIRKVPILGRCEQLEPALAHVMCRDVIM